MLHHHRVGTAGFDAFLKDFLRSPAREGRRRAKPGERSEAAQRPQPNPRHLNPMRTITRVSYDKE
jgi:hypothetical protein